MDLGIKDKRVLITGASQGIGKEIALEFAKEGCRVSIISRRKCELEKVVEEMGGEKKGHSFYAIDLMTEGAPTKAVKYLTKDEPYEIVVHNVGGTLNIKEILSSAEDWHKVWKYNVGIAIEMNNLLIPQMQKNKWGRIINISSLSAEKLRDFAPYGTAKAYLNAYTKVLAREVAKDGIVVSALMPGTIYSAGGPWDENNKLNRGNKKEFLRKKDDYLKHYQALGRLGTVEEIAPFALFMASKYVTFSQGTLIKIDGGAK